MPREIRQPLYFTSVRWRNSRFELWDSHLERLKKSFLKLGLTSAKLKEVVERINIWKSSFWHQTDLAVRIECILTKNLDGDFRVHTRALNLKSLPERVKLSFRRVDEALYPGGELKIWAYDKIFEDLENAQAQGFHDVVYLKKSGELLDASTSNICIIQDSVLYVAEPGPGILKGLYLERFLQVAHDLGYKVRRQSLYQADVEDADNLLLTNCLKGVRLAEGIEKSYNDTLLWKGRINEIERLMHE